MAIIAHMLRHRSGWITFRSHAPVVPDLPLNVRSVGNYHVTPQWRETPRQKWFLQLFWGVEGRGRFQVDKQWHPLEAGEIFFYYPGDTHFPQAQSEIWKYCWLTFDHQDSKRWLEGFGLRERRRKAGPCPQRHFSQIATALRASTAEGERRAAHLAHALLLKASANTSSSAGSNSLAARAKSYIDQHFSNPGLGISEIAEKLQIHRSTLFRIFIHHYGLKPSIYLHNVRVQRGLALLRENSSRIQEVAWQAGFSDPNYFSRVVRNSTGMSPEEFRRS